MTKLGKLSISKGIRVSEDSSVSNGKNCPVTDLNILFNKLKFLVCRTDYCFLRQSIW